MVEGPRGGLVGRRTDGVPPWVFVGATVEQGETAADAAVRETSEETGVVVEALGEIGRRRHPRPAVRWVSPVELDELMPDLFGPVRDHLAAG